MNRKNAPVQSTPNSYRERQNPIYKLERSQHPNLLEQFKRLACDLGIDLGMAATDRVFANCCLEQTTEYMADVDAFSIESGRLRCWEFKRKYRSSNGYFGLDRGFAYGLVNPLSRRGIPLSHAVWDTDELVPDGDFQQLETLIRHVSTHGMDPDGSTGWVHVLKVNQQILRESERIGRQLKTAGSKSGLHGGRRWQLPLRPDWFRTLEIADSRPTCFVA